MRVLGIDPGIARMGWGVVEVQSSRQRRGSPGAAKLKVKSYGCVETKAGLAIEKRLLVIHEALTKIIDEHKPDVLAIEELFFGANAKTAMIVGQARGVVLLTAAEKGLNVAVYTPLQVKIALTGYGRGEKSQVGQMVKVLLKLPAVPKPDDTADALAVALTHVYSYKSKNNY